MAALHDALKALGPVDFDEVPKDDLKSFISDAFTHAQTIVDSVPLPTPDNDSGGLIVRSRSASSASEMLPSSARSSPPPPEVEDLQKEWKPVKMNPKDNPLGISVYKCAGKDGKGAWFARKSVHEGLGFTKWKRALEREFPETLKVRGGPGEGNIRGIGGERRVEYKDVEGVGKMEGMLTIISDWFMALTINQYIFCLHNFQGPQHREISLLCFSRPIRPWKMNLMVQRKFLDILWLFLNRVTIPIRPHEPVIFEVTMNLSNS